MRTALTRLSIALVLLLGLFAPSMTFAQDSGEIGIGDIVTVDTDGVNLRNDFGTDGDIITTLPIGTSLEVIDGPETADGYTWWLVMILDEDSPDEGKSGWAVEDYLSVDDVEAPDDGGDDDSTPTPEPTVSVTPEPTETPDVDDNDFADAGWIEVLDGPVNIRESAGTDADIVGSLATGDFATIVDGSDIETADSYNWVNIETADGEEGWMATAFLRPLDEDPCADDACEPAESDDPLLSADAVEVIDGPLNVRSSASLDGDVVDTLSTGTILNVFSPATITTADDYDWLSVDYLGDEVFVATEFIAETDETCAESPCVPDESDSDDPFATADDVVVVDGPLNLRAEPGTDAEILEVLEAGDSLPTVTDTALVEADGYTWVKVSRLSGAPREGWLATDFLAVDDGGSTNSGGLTSFEGAEGAFVIEAPLNLRANPDTGADSLFMLAAGDYLWIDALSDDGEPWVADGYTWIRVSVAGEVGYVAIDFIEPA